MHVAKVNAITKSTSSTVTGLEKKLLLRICK